MRTKLPKNWYVVITVENKPVIKEWWKSKGYGDRYWSIGAFYGYSNEYDEPISKSNDCRPKHAIEITFEEFKILVLGEKSQPTEPQYEIY